MIGLGSDKNVYGQYIHFLLCFCPSLDIQTEKHILQCISFIKGELGWIALPLHRGLLTSSPPEPFPLESWKLTESLITKVTFAEDIKTICMFGNEKHLSVNLGRWHHCREALLKTLLLALPEPFLLQLRRRRLQNYLDHNMILSYPNSSLPINMEGTHSWLSIQSDRRGTARPSGLITSNFLKQAS